MFDPNTTYANAYRRALLLSNAALTARDFRVRGTIEARLDAALALMGKMSRFTSFCPVEARADIAAIRAEVGGKSGLCPPAVRVACPDRRRRALRPTAFVPKSAEWRAARGLPPATV